MFFAFRVRASPVLTLNPGLKLSFQIRIVRRSLRNSRVKPLWNFYPAVKCPVEFCEGLLPVKIRLLVALQANIVTLFEESRVDAELLPLLKDVHLLSHNIPEVIWHCVLGLEKVISQKMTNSVSKIVQVLEQAIFCFCYHLSSVFVSAAIVQENYQVVFHLDKVESCSRLQAHHASYILLFQNDLAAFDVHYRLVLRSSFFRDAQPCLILPKKFLEKFVATRTVRHNLLGYLTRKNQNYFVSSVPFKVQTHAFNVQSSKSAVVKVLVKISNNNLHLSKCRKD